MSLRCPSFCKEYFLYLLHFKVFLFRKNILDFKHRMLHSVINVIAMCFILSIQSKAADCSLRVFTINGVKATEMQKDSSSTVLLTLARTRS